MSSLASLRELRERAEADARFRLFPRLQGSNSGRLPVWDIQPTPAHALLLAEVGTVIYEQARSHGKIPPGVLLLIGANVSAFLYPGGLKATKVCLSPYCVVRHREYYRLIISAFVHQNPTHILSNMTALIAEGSWLEQKVGTVKFLGQTSAAILLSSSLYVSVNYLLARHTLHKQGYYVVGSVGFSMVGMAMSVISGYQKAGSVKVLGAFSIPSEFMCWYQLLMAHLLIPSSSTTGHACGIAAGLLLMHVPGLKRLIGAGRSPTIRKGQISRNRQESSPRYGWLKTWGLHALCAAGVAAVQYAMAASREGRTPQSNPWHRAR